MHRQKQVNHNLQLVSKQTLAVAQSFADADAIRYILPVLRMTSRLPTVGLYDVWLRGHKDKMKHQGQNVFFCHRSLISFARGRQQCRKVWKVFQEWNLGGCQPPDQAD